LEVVVIRGFGHAGSAVTISLANKASKYATIEIAARDAYVKSYSQSSEGI